MLGCRVQALNPACRTEPNVQKLAIYGKGGIGKSTLAANLSFAYSKLGKRVLHIGCDPKHDSTLLLTHNVPVVPVAELILRDPNRAFTLADMMKEGVNGIGCIESGGPEPGIGCGGWVISRLIEMLEDASETLEDRDLILFDVLGDVVCGGFASPLRQGYATGVIVVVSEELLSIFAANNIAKMLARFAPQGVRLLGLVVNRRDNSASLALVEQFAARISAPILAVLPRDPELGRVERLGRTALEALPETPFSLGLSRLAETLCNQSAQAGSIPTPMSDDEVLAFLRASPA